MKKLGITLLAAAFCLPILAKTPQSAKAPTTQTTKQTTKKHVKKPHHKKTAAKTAKTANTAKK